MVKLNFSSIGFAPVGTNPNAEETRLGFVLFEEGFAHVFPVVVVGSVDGLRESQRFFGDMTGLERHRARKFYVLFSLVLMHELLVRHKIELRDSWEHSECTGQNWHVYDEVIVPKFVVPAALEEARGMIGRTGDLVTELNSLQEIWIARADVRAAFCKKSERDSGRQYYGNIPMPYALYFTDDADWT